MRRVQVLTGINGIRLFSAQGGLMVWVHSSRAEEAEIPAWASDYYF